MAGLAIHLAKVIEYHIFYLTSAEFFGPKREQSIKLESNNDA